MAEEALPERTGVFACEPQPIVVEALQRVLAESTQFVFAGAAAVLSDALEAIRRIRPRILLIDQSYGMKSTAQFLSEVWAVSPGTRAVLWAAAPGSEEWVRALQIGARAVLNKTLPVSALFHCLEAVGAGRVWMGDGALNQPSSMLTRNAGGRLTRREAEVVSGVVRGLRNREIAAELEISEATVKVHLMHVFEKTGVRDRFELAAAGKALLEGRREGEVPERDSRRLT